MSKSKENNTEQAASSAVETVVMCWRGTDGDLEPVECIVDGDFGWPHKCTVKETGEVENMYDNTHFRIKEEAWESIVKSVNAGVSLSKSRLEEAEVAYNEAKELAGECISEYLAVKNNDKNPFSAKM